MAWADLRLPVDPSPALHLDPRTWTCGCRCIRPSSHHARVHRRQLRGRDPGPLCCAPDVLALANREAVWGEGSWPLITDAGDHLSGFLTSGQRS